MVKKEKITNKNHKQMKKLITITIILTIVIIACKGKTTKDELPEGLFVAVHIYRDSTRNVEIMKHVFQPDQKYDSANKKNIPILKEKWGAPYSIPLIDSITKKVILDSLGKPKMDPELQYYEVPIDSVDTKVEGIPLSELLKKR